VCVFFYFFQFFSSCFYICSRFGWLKAEDVEVINSLAIPLGDERDPVNIPDEEPTVFPGKMFSTNEELFLLGVALTAVLLMCIILCLYYRLQVI
jgi:hypothetical protein